MYPATYYENFMRYEASNEVFVAMPFSAPFQHAFETVIEPAIKSVTVGGKPLSARIINRATSGAPDIHEKIFDAIIHSRMVIADMTVQASFAGDAGAARWQANANVAYEVGLACAWRNPEDILLVHQPHPDHSYSFDIQNLRHVSYDLADPQCVLAIAGEVVRALNQSSFLATRTYEKVLQSVSPSAIQLMHQEARRAFPVVAFPNENMPMMDARIHAVTELLDCGALRNRHVIPQGDGKGVAVIYEWTELGLRMLSSLQAVTPERRIEIAAQIASVPSGAVPPPELRDLPEPEPVAVSEEAAVDMVEATQVGAIDEATSE
jgi:hypothetical protein